MKHPVVHRGTCPINIWEIDGGAQLSGIAQKLANNKKSTIFIQSSSYLSRALVVAGAEGAAAPVNFEQRVHAPVNFQPF